MSRASLKTTEQPNAVNGVARHDHQVGVRLTRVQHRELIRLAQARGLYTSTLAAALIVQGIARADAEEPQ